MEVLGEKIKYYRNGLHLGQNYVAKYLNLTLEDYCELERGRSILNIDDVKKLCVLFGVTTTQLTELKVYEDDYYNNVIKLREDGEA